MRTRKFLMVSNEGFVEGRFCSFSLLLRISGRGGERKGREGKGREGKGREGGEGEGREGERIGRGVQHTTAL